MAFTPFQIFILMCAICSMFYAIECQPVLTQNVLLGSDVSLHCEVSFLSKSSTLYWEKDEGQTANTTLIYNNSAYIILHTVNENSGGKYYCKLTEDVGVQNITMYKLNVTSNSYERNNKLLKSPSIFRQCSNNSDLSLICKSSRTYKKWKWTWEQRPNEQIDLMTVESGGEVQIKGPIKPGKCSSTKYNSQSFNFHISPVNFSYSGTYKCITETTNYTTIILRTIRVSVEPPDGEWRSKSVVLTCELSEVTDPVTLVWLRMEGNRGVLEKQQIMTEKNKMLQLTVNLSGYETENLLWQCAVFTENKLRALGPVNSDMTNCPTETSTFADQESDSEENMDLQKGHLQIVIVMATAVSVSLVILLGLMFRCQRKTEADRLKTYHTSSQYLQMSDCSTTVIYSCNQ